MSEIEKDRIFLYYGEERNSKLSVDETLIMAMEIDMIYSDIGKVKFKTIFLISLFLQGNNR